MHNDLLEDFAINRTLRAFQRQAANFGTFPMPADTTVLGGETLHRCLKENDAPAAGAISIVELRSAGKHTFIAVASGRGVIGEDVGKAWQALMRTALGGSYTTVDCLVLETSAIFYSPAHTDTVKFITDAFPGFVLPASPLDTPDLTLALQNLNNLPDGKFGHNAATGNQLGDMRPTLNAIHELLAVAVALRINAFNSANANAARVTVAGFRAAQNGKFGFAGRQNFVDNIEALALRGGNPNTYAYQDDPEKPISDIRSIQSKVGQAWRVADLNRFCAEPKAFTYIKTYGLKDPVAGQLAMWWDSARPNNYTFPGSDKGPYSDYMLPCTSCRARSAVMMAGVLLAAAAPLEMREEPTAHVVEQPMQRARRASFSV